MHDDKDREETTSHGLLYQAVMALWFGIYNTPIVAVRSPWMTSTIVIITGSVIAAIHSYTPDGETPWVFGYVFLGSWAIGGSLFLWAGLHPERWVKGREFSIENDMKRNPNKESQAPPE